MTDQFEPAYRTLVVACKSDKRWFDLDAVREPGGARVSGTTGFPDRDGVGANRVMRANVISNPAGAPPLDYWLSDTQAGVDRVLKSMLPERVCRVCGEPSRRITSEQPQATAQEAIAALIEDRRTALGITRAEMVPWFIERYKNADSVTAQVSNWERAKNVPSAADWETLKERLDISDEFDAVVVGERTWTESTIDYVTGDGAVLEDERRGGDSYGRGGHASPNQLHASRAAKDDWTDCNHNDWRAGVVLDPFELTSERNEVGSARYIIGDVFDALESLPDNSVDLVFSSPPFLALRSYLPADHPLKDKEIGSEATPADFLDTLLDVVEACDRVLAPHGSLCFELGDTFAGSGGAGGDYNDGGLRDGQPKFKQSGWAGWDKQDRNNPHAYRKDDGTTDLPREPRAGGNGWPLPKSLSGIPTLFAWSLAYGRNLLRPERTTPRWRIRNVVVWARPNPPVGALGDKFRPATSYLTVACKSDKRWFDLDAVRSEDARPPTARDGDPKQQMARAAGIVRGAQAERTFHAEDGAPPLDYWEIPTQPYPGSHYATWPQKLCVRPIKSMCPPFVCLGCGVALDSKHERPNAMPGVWGTDHVQPLADETDSQGSADGSVLLEDMLDPTLGEATSGVEAGSAGLHPSLGGRQVRDATPVGHGADDRPRTDAGRSGASPERGQGRQSAGELGTARQAGARSQVEASTPTVPVPSLPGVDADNGDAVHACPNCGSTEFRNGVTLDCFAGSGTTLAVATGHGRDAIGIDIDERNAELALERVGPLFLEVEHLADTQPFSPPAEDVETEIV